MQFLEQNILQVSSESSQWIPYHMPKGSAQAEVAR